MRDEVVDMQPSVSFAAPGHWPWRMYLSASSAAAAAGDEGAASADTSVCVIAGAVQPVFAQVPELFRVPTGAVLVLCGRLQMASEAAQSQVCFARTFEKDKGMACDYFSCETCGISWICQVRQCSR